MPAMPTENCGTIWNSEKEIKSMCLRINSKNTRKALKLLLKQYGIEEIRKEPNEFQDNIIVRESPFVIKYFDRFSNDIQSRKYFEWIIPSNEFDLN